MKKALALILSFVMILSVIPFAVFAEEIPQQASENTEPTKELSLQTAELPIEGEISSGKCGKI